MKKKLHGFDESPEVDIHRESLRVALKRIPIWKMPGHDGLHGFWFLKFTSIHDRLLFN